MVRLIFATLLILLTACTGYKPLGTDWPADGYGYREEQLAPGRYRLEYLARAEVDNAESTAREYWHRRAGELCNSPDYRSSPLEQTLRCQSYLDFSGDLVGRRQVCKLHLTGTLECGAP